MEKHNPTKMTDLSVAKKALLNKYLSGQLLSKVDNNVTVIPKRSGDEKIPLSFSQQRLWLLHQLDSESVAYNLSIALKLTGQLNIAIIENCFNEIIRRHEVLRTSFQTLNENQLQIISPESSFSLAYTNLSLLPESEREHEALRFAKEEALLPFDLSMGSLLRATLFALDKEAESSENILFLTLHHIIADGWSLSVLIREFTLLYKAFLFGYQPDLPELPIQYADYTIWQRERLQGPLLDKHLAYWTKYLKTASSVLELPTDWNRPSVKSNRGARYRFLISDSLTINLNALSKKRKTTLFATLISVFNVLLYRYSHQDDITIGYPVANRTQVEAECLIGFFLNTLLLRTDLSGNPVFIELLKQVTENVFSAQEYQELPFERLVEELRPNRNMSYNPLFQVMFVLQNTPSEKIELTGLNIEQLSLETDTSLFDLSLLVIETEDGMEAVFEYCTDLFQEKTIARMAKHFNLLLECFSSQPDLRINSFNLLTEDEAYLINNEAALETVSTDLLLHNLFEKLVIEKSNAKVVVSKVGCLNYQELNERSNQLAHELQKQGVKPEVYVGLCIDRSPEAVIGVMGILKAGGVYVPLDPNYPKERLEYMLASCKASLVVTKECYLDLLAGCDLTMICMDCDGADIAANPVESAKNLNVPENAAYLIFTSGSTGKPKGVVVTHKTAVASTKARSKYYSEKVGGFLMLSSFSFDSSVAGVFWTLADGGRLCLPTEDEIKDPKMLAEWIANERLTHLLCLPSLYSMILEEAFSAQLQSLRTAIVAGESCPHELLVKHYHLLSKVQLYNEYGPTENTVWSSVYHVGIREIEANVPISIGRPIADIQIYLLDSYLNPVPVGVVGQIYIAGIGLARGYFGWTDLTAERFVPNPFSKIFGSRMYKSGDLARYREDGNIDFLGRIDHQVKIRGFRIELGEIENCIRKKTSHLDVAVIVHKDNRENKRLIAYLLNNPESPTDVEMLRTQLKTTLPEHMVPAAFICLDQFPLTPNGKVDRKMFPEPDFRVKSSQQTDPRNATEEILVKIWCQTLGIDQLGIEDNFFALGGDSILSMQVVNRAKQLGLIISPRQMFECQNIAALAEVIESNTEIWSNQGTVTGKVPMLSIQQWFFDQNFFNSNHWNQSVLLEVTQSVDPLILQTVMSRLLQHHDILRSRFSEQNGFWEQRLLDNTENQIDVVSVDFTDVSDDQRPALLIEQASKWQRSLNLSDGSLVKVVWFNYGPGSNDRLLIIIHHLVVDTVSWRILLEDMSSLYQQTVDGYEMYLPKKTTDFKYWAESLSAYAQTKAPEDSLAYWLNTDWKAVKELPIDINGGVNTEESGEILSVLFDAQKTSVLLQKAQLIYGGQIQEILIASLVSVLTEWIEGALLLELEGHGRENIFDNTDVSRTVGWFTAIYPLLFELTPEQDSLKTFNLVKEKMHTIPNHGIDFGVMRYLNRNPILKKQIEAVPEPQVGFNYLGRVDQGVEVSSMFSLSLESSGYQKDLKAKRARLLAIDVSIVRGEMHIQWNYSRACHFRETIEHLANKLLVKLDAYYAECLKKDVPDPIVSIKTKQTEYLINLEKEAVLDASIKPIQNTGESTNISQNILLTGVTGFVGAFLLEELLDKFKGKIYCLIRAGSYQKAHDRIEKTLRQYKIHNPSKEQRIILVVGDLAKPLLGLSENRFNELSHQIDMIYHNGSATNLMLPYHAMKAPNVYGTCEILRLACTSKTKPVHYISTLSIFDDGSEPKIGCYPEYDLPTLKTRLTIGYSQSKLVAEHIIQIARKRGLPVTVYRLGAVTGHGESGAWNINDFHFQFLKACLDIGMFPLNIKRFQLMPVDYVSRAIISLSNNKSSYGANFHIFNPQSIALQDLITWVNRYGYKVEKVLPSVWLNAFFEHLSKNPEHPLHTLVGMMEAFIEQDHDKSSPYVCDTTLKLLKKVGITLPVVDEFIFDKSLDYMLGKSALVEVSNKPNEDIPTYE